MKFKLDENMPLACVSQFIAAGHDACSVLDQGLLGSRDIEIWAVCSSERRALVTLDLDFSDIRRYPPNDHAGIIVLRPRDEQVASIAGLVAQLIEMLGSYPLAGHLWSVDERAIRVRGSRPHP